MADTRKCMYLYHSWLPALEALSDAECGRLLRCALQYSATGQASDLPGNERFTWPLIRYQIDADSAKYLSKIEKLREAGLASANKCQHMSTNAVKEKEKEKEIEKEIENGKERRANADAFAEFAGDNADLLKALREFSSMRSKIKAPLTDAAKTRLLSKLKREFAPNEWVAVLNQSVDKCWKDIYPLKSADQQPSPARKPKQYTTAEEYHSRETNINTSQLDKIRSLIGGDS